MLRSRFLWKLYAGYVALILVSTVTVGLLIARRIEPDTLDEVRASLRTRAALLRDAAASALADPSPAAFQERVTVLGAETATRLTVIGEDGVVVADSEREPALMNDHAGRPEIVAASSAGEGSAIRFSETVGRRMMYVALPIRRDGSLLGFVRASLPLSAIDERMSELRGVVVLGAGVGAIVALLLGFLMARRFAAPLASMTEVAESMSHGDYEQTLPATRKDEVGMLARALNQMALRSRERMETITTDRNKLAAILAGMIEGVVAVDREERLVHINETAASILRAGPDDLIGKRVWEVSRVAEVHESLAQTLADGRESRHELRLVGRPRDQVVEMHASPLRNGEGELVGAVAVLHDVTELKRLETMRRDFVGNVSHELKTPITAIRGLVETLIDDREVDSDTRDRFLGKISDQALRLSSLVTDLLALSRLEAAGAGLELESVDLRSVVRSAHGPLVHVAEERGVTVEVDVPGQPVLVHGDAEALRQVVTNLLDNALKYTARGGRVWVRLTREGDRAHVEVEDTGMGIDAMHLDRLFERFYRVDKARSRELGGTGLGLSIVKHVVLAHDGDLAVESTPGKGSTFRVDLPLGSDTAQD